MPNGEPQLLASDHVLLLTPSANSHLRDFDNVFKPESDRLHRTYQGTAASCRVVRVPVAAIDPKTLKVLSGQPAFEAAARAAIDAIADGTPWTHIVMLCHGWPAGIQLGFRSRQQRGRDVHHWNELVGALKGVPIKTVTLFACSAGKDPITRKGSPGTGDDSFGDGLRDAVGATVIAHTTVGHATRNPNLITFESSPSPLIGGIHLAPRGSGLFKNAARLLSNLRKKPGTPAPGDVPPQGHTRPAFASIPLCRSALEMQALLSATP